MPTQSSGNGLYRAPMSPPTSAPSLPYGSQYHPPTHYGGPPSEYPEHAPQTHYNPSPQGAYTVTVLLPISSDENPPGIQEVIPTVVQVQDRVGLLSFNLTT